mmetsp:Transcript_16754/g.28108  ORF Transcript_16754/g.28108 Transcript_16754/m.28108 type:complete len:342 (+) Transcript_16754:892-1917(+)
MNVAVEASLKSASTVFTVEVVISRFRENILHCLELICKEGTFDEEIDVKVTIYNKGGDDCAEILQSAVDKKKGKFDRIVQLLRDPNKFRIISLDNLGREAHPYLFHVVHNYNDMASVTVFLPATCMNQVKEDHTVKLLQRVNTTRNTVIAGQWMAPSIRNRLGSFIISKWSGRDSDNAKLLTESNAVDCMPATRRPFSAWYDHFFPGIKTHVASYYSMLAVHRDLAWKKEVGHYTQLLDELDVHSNPETGHFMERSWEAVFYPVPDACLFAARPIKQENSRVTATGSGSARATSDMSFAQLMNSYGSGSKKRSAGAVDSEKDRGASADRHTSKKQTTHSTK